MGLYGATTCFSIMFWLLLYAQRRHICCFITESRGPRLVQGPDVYRALLVTCEQTSWAIKKSGIYKQSTIKILHCVIKCKGPVI